MAVSSHNKKKKKRKEKLRNAKKYEAAQASKFQTTVTDLRKQARQCEVLKESFVAMIDKMPKEHIGELKENEHYINLMESLDKVEGTLASVVRLSKFSNVKTIQEMQSKIVELQALELTMTTSMYGASRYVDELIKALKEKRESQAALEDLPEPELIEDGVISENSLDESTEEELLMCDDEEVQDLLQQLKDNTSLPDIEVSDRLARGTMTNIESYDEIGFETPDLEAVQRYGYVDHEHTDDEPSVLVAGFESVDGELVPTTHEVPAGFERYPDTSVDESFNTKITPTDASEINCTQADQTIGRVARGVVQNIEPYDEFGKPMEHTDSQSNEDPTPPSCPE